ncbi:MAG: Verru_Chthon cassette protein B [Verrucomicrobiales bacterium]|nr:Verru_Chthon cassette protein B [Verrucomicrobiales bacterium]
MRDPIPNPPSRCGLTLIEVALSLAIAAMVLTILAGTLGSTVEFAAEGFDRFAMARISQTLSDENRMLDWNQLGTEIQDGEIFFFDERGRRLDSKSEEAVYAARLRLVDSPVLPGSVESDHLKRLMIEVSARGRAEDPFAALHPVRRFASLYTRMESVPSTSKGE